MDFAMLRHRSPNNLALCAVVPTILVVGQAILGGCASNERRDEIVPPTARLQSLSGEEVAANAVLKKGRFVFFTCGYDNCARVARQLQAVSGQGILIAALPSSEVKRLVERYHWNGEAFTDPGSRFSLQNLATDCPKVAEAQGSALVFKTVDELLASRRVPL